MIVILCVYFLLCAIYGGLLVRHWWQKTKREAILTYAGVSVPGQIVGQRLGLEGWGIVYSYHYQGKDYQNTRTVLGWDLFREHKVIAVLCLPDDPTTALAQLKGSPSESILVELFSLLFIIMAVIALFIILRFYVTI